MLCHLDGEGAIMCSTCAGQPERFGCRTCGSENHLQGTHCAPCRLNARLRVLLDNGSGNIAEPLQPLHAYLLTLGGSDAVLKWIRREPVPSTLSEMATGAAPISHRTIDALDPSTKVRYLRRTLISAGVLPEIDVLLNATWRPMPRACSQACPRRIPCCWGVSFAGTWHPSYVGYSRSGR